MLKCNVFVHGMCVCVLFGRLTVAGLLGREFFKEENPSPVVKVNSNRKDDDVLSFHVELKDFETQDRTLVDFSFNMAHDAPEEVAKDMVSLVLYSCDVAERSGYAYQWSRLCLVL